MTAPTLKALGEGWTATTTYGITVQLRGGKVRRMERAIVAFTHELGGRAEAVYHRPLTGGDWVLAAATAWTVCTDPGCSAARGFAHSLTEPKSISGDELGVLMTDVVALTL